MQDKFTGKSRGFAFVTMATEADAQKAIAELNGKTVEGRPLTVNEARPREARPPAAAAVVADAVRRRRRWLRRRWRRLRWWWRRRSSRRWRRSTQRPLKLTISHKKAFASANAFFVLVRAHSARLRRVPHPNYL